jgi:carbon monoxide dehydrogenase subunit G
VLETRVAYLHFHFKAVVKISELSPPERIEAKIEATPLGIVGRLTATAKTQLEESGDKTIIRYSIEATLSGKLGSMGQPVLMSKAKEMEKHFTARLVAAFAGGGSGSKT